MIKVLRGPLRSVWALQNQTLATVGSQVVVVRGQLLQLHCVNSTVLGTSGSGNNLLAGFVINASVMVFLYTS